MCENLITSVFLRVFFVSLLSQKCFSEQKTVTIEVEAEAPEHEEETFKNVEVSEQFTLKVSAEPGKKEEC